MRAPLVSATVASSVLLALTLVAGEAEARIAKGPWVQRLGPTSAVIRVEVDPPAPVSIEVGAPPSDAGAHRVVEDKEARALHSVQLTGLEPATRYPYTVRAASEASAGAFTTAPRDDAKEPYKFLIYGDNRTDDTAHAAVVKAMLATPADFLVHTGDLVEDGGSAHDWRTFFDIEAPLLRDRCVFACVGNHELTDRSGIAFARYFAPGDSPTGMEARAIDPKFLAGTFRWQSARFFLVNGMVPYRAGPDRSWLERALSDADSEPGVEWRIVVLHHGPWSSGPHGDNLHLADANIPQLLRSHKVDLVLSGHDHIYERGAVDGLAYVVSGGGGAPPYRVRDLKPYAKKLESTRHFVEASVDAEGIGMRVVRVDGSVIERCALKKKIGWDCDAKNGAPEIGPKPDTSGAPAPPSSPAPRTSSCACEVAVGRDVPPGGAGLAAFAAAIALAARARRVGGAGGDAGPPVAAGWARARPASRVLRLRPDVDGRASVEGYSGMRTASLALGMVLVTALSAAEACCATNHDQLVRSQRALDADEHERALALLRDLEPDMHRLAEPDQAKYCYLRGTADYRIGHRADARHWLALARTFDEASPGVLPADWKARLGEALEEMNGVVYEGGTAALHHEPEHAPDQGRGDKGLDKKAKPAR